MTVTENVALGGHGRFDRRVTANRIRELASSIGARIDPDALAGTLSVPAQQQLEIIKALSRNAKLLIMDEPTAVLPPAEAERLLGQLRALADRGLSIVLITHKLRDALAVADDVTVLRAGATVLVAPAASLSEADLSNAMVGGTTHEASDPDGSVNRAPARATATRQCVVRARDLTVPDDRGITRVSGVDLEVRPGEIVGIAGVEGSGVHELLRVLARRVTHFSGSLEIPSAIGFVPEDRHHEAVVLDLTLTENLALRHAGLRSGLAPWQAIRDRARAMLTTFDIRSPGTEVPLRVLSGGNQQKLVLARELEGSPELLIAQNPTRGLDSRATAAIHQRLRAARDAGMAVVMYSSDLDELVQLADRTMAMFAGTLIPVARDRHAIGQAMLGLTDGGSAQPPLSS